MKIETFVSRVTERLTFFELLIGCLVSPACWNLDPLALRSLPSFCFFLNILKALCIMIAECATFDIFGLGGFAVRESTFELKLNTGYKIQDIQKRYMRDIRETSKINQ